MGLTLMVYGPLNTPLLKSGNLRFGSHSLRTIDTDKI